jgi:hypothetical protein
MTIRAAATWLFGFIATAMCTAFISANVRELARQRGWDTFLVRCWDALPEQWRDNLGWERLRELWWLWSIFGVSGGITLALWLAPVGLETVDAQSTQPKSAFLSLDDGQKWRFSDSLRSMAVAQSGERISCEYVLGLSTNDQFVWGTWVELQPMLDLAWWRHTASGDLGLGQRQFPAGFTILTGSDNGPGFICAASLGRALQDTLSSRMPVTVRTNQVTEALTGCRDNCVELDIGNFQASASSLHR